MPTAQNSNTNNLARIAVLCTVVALGAFGFCLAGAPLPVIAILVVLVLGLGSAAILSKPASAEVQAPDQAAFPDLHQTLDNGVEREDFFDLV